MPARTRPNILLTIADDQRHDLIGALGHPDLRTPALDALARRGVMFTRAHHMGSTHGAVCAPSRAMLHTGLPLYQIPNAIKMNWGPFPAEALNPDPASIPLLGELLRRGGHHCYGIGKWHNSPPAFMRSFDGGSEIFFGGMADPFNTQVHDFNPTGRYEPSAAHTAPGHATDAFAEAAIAFIRRYAQSDRRQPFFLYLGFTAPHDPRTAPPQWHARYDPARITLPGNLLPEHPFDNGELRVRDEMLAAFPRDESEIRRHIADYYAMTAHMDDAIGRIHAALAQAGLVDDTVVVHTADHGLAVGQHGLMGKQNLYDHSVRVPLLIAGPGFESGRRDERLAYMHDLFPTLLESASLQSPNSGGGGGPFRSLLAAPAADRASVFSVYRECQRMVRDDRYKLIAYYVNGQRRRQVFDLHADPLEMQDLATDAAAHPIVQRLEVELARWRRAVGDPAEW